MTDHILRLLRSLTDTFEATEKDISGKDYNGFRLSLSPEKRQALQDAREIYSNGFHEGASQFRHGEFLKAQKILSKAIESLKILGNFWKLENGNS